MWSGFQDSKFNVLIISNVIRRHQNFSNFPPRSWEIPSVGLWPLFSVNSNSRAQLRFSFHNSGPAYQQQLGTQCRGFDTLLSPPTQEQDKILSAPTVLDLGSYHALRFWTFEEWPRYSIRMSSCSDASEKDENCNCWVMSNNRKKDTCT